MVEFNNNEFISESLLPPPIPKEAQDPIGEIHNAIKAKADEKLSNFDQLDYLADERKYFSSMFDTKEQQKVGFKENRIDVKDAYTRLSDGTYITRYDKGYTLGLDNEDIYAQSQTTGDKWVNGITKFGLKTINNVVGGTLGTAWGAVSAVADQNWERVYDNSFYDFLDDVNTKTDNFIPNYRKQEERDLGFFDSMGTANFWADDFLGGLSFMTGTVISEGLWGVATGGTSLTTAAARTGLRASKYFNTAKALTKGVKKAGETFTKYATREATELAAKNATIWGIAGESANLLRFTYTSAGFEAGMETRLYKKEQRDNFYRDFKEVNGYEPTPIDIADFNKNLDSTANALWATNMALVGTSNFAILGKSFGITSPFKSSSKFLDKQLFGNGVKSTFSETGERLATEAVKRSTFQKSLGFTTGLIKNPLYEGFIEEGGQATASTAMEEFLESRYNKSKDVMSVAESVYNGFSTTYGTKEGWKEVGLGALIGLFGGQSVAAFSGQGLFKESRDALKDQDENSVNKATSMNENLGTGLLDKVMTYKVQSSIDYANEVNAANQAYDSALAKGSVMEQANAESRLMLTSIKQANTFDYGKEQLADFNTALKSKVATEEGKQEFIEKFGIEDTKINDKIQELTSNFQQISDRYDSHKKFADYIVSDNPKEISEDATDIDVETVRQAIAYQMSMTKIMENNMDGAHGALTEAMNQLSSASSINITQSLNTLNQLNKASKKDKNLKASLENKLSVKRKQLDRLNRALELSDNEGNKKVADKISPLENEIQDLTVSINEVNEKILSTKDDMSFSGKARFMANQLDAIDPLVDESTRDSITIEGLKGNLTKIDQLLADAKSKNPELYQKIGILAREYNTGLEMWKRNADTVALLADGDVGLKRIGTMFQKKKQANPTTLEFLQGIQKTVKEEDLFAKEISNLMTRASSGSNTVGETKTEQQKADESPGENPANITLSDIYRKKSEDIEKLNKKYEDVEDKTQKDKELKDINEKYDKQVENFETPIEETLVQTRVRELKEKLKNILTTNSSLLNNFTDNPNKLIEDIPPKEEDVSRFQELKNKEELSEDESAELDQLSQKMLDWRVIVGTSDSNGISIQDILNQIDLLEKEVNKMPTTKTVEEIMEHTSENQDEFKVDGGDKSIFNTTDKVVFSRTKDHTSISHMGLESISNRGFLIEKIGEVNPNEGNEAEVYRITDPNNNSYEIYRTKNHRRIVLKNENVKDFFNQMGIQSVGYDLKTSWNYLYQDGVPMESDFRTENIDNPNFNILNAQLIYEMKQGDTLLFSVDMNDKFNRRDMELVWNDDSLTESQKEEQIKALMHIYVTNTNGDVVASLKAGKEEEGSNFDKVRQYAVENYIQKLKDGLSLEQVANDTVGTRIDIPYTTTLEKVFMGSPNTTIGSDNRPVMFSINEVNYDKVESIGFYENGELNENDNVRKTFMPKTAPTPYIVINYKNTQIAFPVSLKPSTETLREGALEILQSTMSNSQKVLRFSEFLTENGLSSAQYNIDIVDGSLSDYGQILEELSQIQKSYTKEDIEKMTKEEFLANSETVLDFSKDVLFVSPKIKSNLKATLRDTRDNTESEDNPMTQEQRENFIRLYLGELSTATNEKEVKEVVEATQDTDFYQEFISNPTFKKEVENVALNNKSVPVIRTQQSTEEYLREVLDSTSTQVPLNLQEDFKKDVIEVFKNPTLEKLRALAKRIMAASKNQYKVVQASMDTENLYYISTSQSDKEMFDNESMVRVYDNYYKKVGKDFYNERQLIEALYDKHKKGFLPSHLEVPMDISFEDFSNFMPKDLFSIYTKYYNTLPREILSKNPVQIGNEDYLKNEFKGDFARFIDKNREDRSDLYKSLLHQFDVSGVNITKSDLLTKQQLDRYRGELGTIYDALLEYSLINKHIDFGIAQENIIFTEDGALQEKLEKLNSGTLFEPKGKGTRNNDGTISFKRLSSKDYIKIQEPDGNYAMYEKVDQGNQGEYVFQKVADIDPNFVTTDIEAKVNNTVIIDNSEINDAEPTNKTTEGTKIDCNQKGKVL